MNNDLRISADSLLQEAFEVLEAKQAMYVGDGNPFKNFLTIEDVTGIPADKIVIARMVDKVYRIQNIHVHSHNRSARDSVRDALVDLINYAILYMYYLDFREVVRDISKR